MSRQLAHDKAVFPKLYVNYIQSSQSDGFYMGLYIISSDSAKKIETTPLIIPLNIDRIHEIPFDSGRLL